MNDVQRHEFMEFRLMTYRSWDWEFVDVGGSSGHANKSGHSGELSPRDHKTIRSGLGLSWMRIDNDVQTHWDRRAAE